MDNKPNIELLKELNKNTDRHFAKSCTILNQNRTEVTQIVKDAVGKELHFLKEDLYSILTGRDFREDFGDGKKIF